MKRFSQNRFLADMLRSTGDKTLGDSYTNEDTIGGAKYYAMLCGSAKTILGKFLFVVYNCIGKVNVNDGANYVISVMIDVDMHSGLLSVQCAECISQFLNGLYENG